MSDTTDKVFVCGDCNHPWSEHVGAVKVGDGPVEGLCGGTPDCACRQPDPVMVDLVTRMIEAEGPDISSGAQAMLSILDDASTRSSEPVYEVLGGKTLDPPLREGDAVEYAEHRAKEASRRADAWIILGWALILVPPMFAHLVWKPTSWWGITLWIVAVLGAWVFALVKGSHARTQRNTWTSEAIRMDRDAIRRKYVRDMGRDT